MPALKDSLEWICQLPIVIHKCFQSSNVYLIAQIARLYIDASFQSKHNYLNGSESSKIFKSTELTTRDDYEILSQRTVV